jgi:murein DD-endopeptidase MepM/ murein hydrolase activator NlpD
MQNDKLKSIVLIVGALVLVVLVAKHPHIVSNPGFEAAPGPSDSIGAGAPEKGPDFAGIVSPNTSFFDIMRECGIDPPSIKWIEKAVRNVYDFRRIHPGQRYEVYAAEDGSIERMHFSVDDESYIHIDIKDGEISAEKKEYAFQVNLKTAAGVISSSLFASLDEQGITPELGVQLTNIFAWDIDFFTDMRKGDYYRMIYEEKLRFDGMKKIGRIVAAEFTTQGKSHYAFLFPNEDGLPDYFDENGKSLRKQLLKTPLTYSRISSNFSRRRFHPVLHHYAPHLGIDYAAPIGTPVKATGDGTVIEASRNHANGNYIKIRHFNNYITYYLHLSRFGKGICRGARVSQGDVIGYVGQTGYATGPHLDYRIMINNRFVNPRSISLPPARPVTSANMASFIDLRDRHLARLGGIKFIDGAAQAIAAGAAAIPEPGASAGIDKAQSSAPY